MTLLQNVSQQYHLQILCRLLFQPIEEVFCRAYQRRITLKSALILEKFVGFLMGKHAISHSSKLSSLVFQHAVLLCGEEEIC